MIGAVVLAAGLARRYGTQKLLIPLDGEPIIRRTVEQMLASAVDEVLVVLGHDAAELRVALEDLPVRCIEHREPESGMAGSLARGIGALAERTRGRAEAAVIALGDQPTVTPEIVNRVIETWQSSHRPVVVPMYDGVRGHPVLFDAALFGELLELTGDRGGRDVIERDPSRVAAVELQGAVPPDLDEPADLEAVRLEWRRARAAARARATPERPPRA